MCSESSWLFGFTDSREEDAMAGMLWCEQWWTLLPVLSDSSASRVDKVASVCHMVAYYMLSHQLITPHWKWTKHPFPNMKSGRHKCSCMFWLFHILFWSGYQQRGAGLYRQCHTSKPSCHWGEERGKVGKEGAFQEEFRKSGSGSEKELFGAVLNIS